MLCSELSQGLPSVCACECGVRARVRIRLRVCVSCGCDVQRVSKRLRAEQPRGAAACVPAATQRRVSVDCLVCAGTHAHTPRCVLYSCVLAACGLPGHVLRGRLLVVQLYTTPECCSCGWCPLQQPSRTGLLARRRPLPCGWGVFRVFVRRRSLCGPVSTRMSTSQGVVFQVFVSGSGVSSARPAPGPRAVYCMMTVRLSAACA
jgi:hypothetical protein